MPHSSGGGSFGGGFHGGGGSFHSSGSTNNGPRYSHHHFPGAFPYVYYSHGLAHVIYTDQDPATQKKAGGWVFVVLGIFFLLPIGILLLDSNKQPEKLPLASEHTISIVDNTNVISDAEEATLMPILKEFQDKSGITPYILTIDNNATSDLEDYAYNYYVRNWYDESHWLIVYSSDAGTQKQNFKFEGMQGDDTDAILYSRVTDTFNDTLYKNLMSDTYTVGAAFEAAYNSILPTLMDEGFYVDPGMIGFCVVWDVIVGLMIIGFIENNKKIGQMKDAVKVENADSLKEKKCPSCGAPYYEGTILCCHKCGQPLDDDNFDNF